MSYMHGLQASWVTVRESLRQLQGPADSVKASDVLQMSQLCPLLLSVGDKKSLHKSWAERNSGPDAAAVVAQSTHQHRASQSTAVVQSCASGEVNTTCAELGRQKSQPGTTSSAQMVGLVHANEQNVGPGDRAAQNVADKHTRLQRVETRARVAVAAPYCSPAGVVASGCGGFLVEQCTGASAGTSSAAPVQQNAGPMQLSCATAQATGNDMQAAMPNDMCGIPEHDSQLQDCQNAQLAESQRMFEGMNFKIHLEDAPHHVVASTTTQSQCSGKRTQSRKRKARTEEAPEGDMSTAAEPTQVDKSSHAVSDAALAEKNADKSEADAVAADCFEQGLPDFAAGSHARRHSAAFKRYLVQAVALLQEACTPVDSTGDNTLALKQLL